MNDYDLRFLEALNASLHKRTVNWEEDPGTECWQALFTAASRHHVLPMVYEACAGCPAAKTADPALFAGVKNEVFRMVIMQARQTAEFRKLYRGMEDAGFSPVIVKGIVCRALYPNPDERMSGDEDLWLPMCTLEPVHEWLTGCGMELSDPETEIGTAEEAAYGKKGSPLYIEVHRSLFPRDAEAYGGMNDCFAGAENRAVRVKAEGLEVLTLAPTDHLLYLICHALKHFLHSGFGIRQVMDICLFAAHYAADIDWERLTEALVNLRADRFTAALMRIGTVYFEFDAEKAGVPEALGGAGIDETDLLSDLLDAGVYGDGSMSRKHSSTITLAAAAADKQGKKSSNGLLKTAFPSAKKLEGRYPYLKEKPYLLPAAWCARFVGYFREKGRVAGDDSAVSSVKIGSERVELLREYGIIR